VLGVIIGSIVGHAACTGAAVLGGKHLAEHIDEKIVGVSTICTQQGMATVYAAARRRRMRGACKAGQPMSSGSVQ